MLKSDSLKKAILWISGIASVLLLFSFRSVFSMVICMVLTIVLLVVLRKEKEP